MNKLDAYDISIGAVAQIIDDWIFNERHRAIMRRKLLDGLTIEEVSNEFGYSPRQIQRILNAGMAIILRKIKYYSSIDKER